VSRFDSSVSIDNKISIVTYPRSGKNWLTWYIKLNTNLDANFTHYFELEKEHPDYSMYQKVFSNPIVTVVRDPIECIASINTMEKGERVQERLDTYLDHYNFFLKNAQMFFLFEDLSNNTGKIVEAICKEFDGKMSIVSESFNHYKFWHNSTQDSRKLISSTQEEDYEKNIKMIKDLDLSEHYRLYNLAKEKCIKFT
jgi:hypothetical protein